MCTNGADLSVVRRQINRAISGRVVSSSRVGMGMGGDAAMSRVDYNVPACPDNNADAVVVAWLGDDAWAPGGHRPEVCSLARFAPACAGQHDA